MSSDKRRFKIAKQKWDLLSQGSFSLPPELGQMAILVTKYGYGNSNKKRQLTLDFMQEEADNYRKSFYESYADSLVSELNYRNLRSAIVNPEVSGLTLIGEGHFSSLETHGFYYPRANWNDVSKWSTHLKQGVIYQRFCGHFRYKLPVPFGMFAATSLKNVWAVAGSQLAPEFDLTTERRFSPVAQVDTMSYEEIKSTFTSHKIIVQAR